MPVHRSSSSSGIKVIELITSNKNPKIQWVRELQGRARARREQGAFVVEGVRLAEEALAAGWAARLVLHTEEINERGRAVVEGFARQGAPVEAVTGPVMHAASDTETPQGLLVVLELRSLPLPEKPDFVFIPDGVRDPGNLGTMLRTAAAAGAGAVLLPPESVDPFAPKVVRAAMGAHFRLPVQPLGWEEIESLLSRHGLNLFLAAAREGVRYDQADFSQPAALLIGGEAEGAGRQAMRLAHSIIHIPMPGGMESLNAAVAAAVLLFEVVRQRAVSYGEASR